MLLRFKFSNFRSFRDEQEFSLVASPLNDRSEGIFHVAALRERILPVAAMYGANASGKTNVLRALHFVQRAVNQSHRVWKPELPFPIERFAGETDERPMRFSVDFVQGDVRHQYGFAANSSGVLEEWLHAYPKGKKQRWFIRKTGRPMSFSDKLTGENRVIEQLTRKNSLFLSAAAQNNHEMLLPTYNWFTNALTSVVEGRAVERQRTINMCSDPGIRSILARLLSFADLGITDINVESPPDEAKDKAEKATEFLLSLFDLKADQVPIERVQTAVKLLHRINGGSTPMALEQESAGTIAYFALLGPLVHALKVGGVICVDELDSSLHPLIAIEIIRIFEDPIENPNGAQLVFNTHDTNLLSTGMLRRDQIWFTEKDAKGESHLYPLTDFKPRKEENLESGYLQGRYGAIPFIHSEELATTLADANGEKKR